ncbi:MAG: hypothetical protein M9899_01545 [Bdellovibrionaceae bacterium]|nr:hypothetical protein [Pseudobdellovibrionaceae bacterium]
MSVTWFMIKSIFVTFVIISILQLRIGKENRTLEVHFTSWMKSLSASRRIQNIAEGGQMLTSDIIKEFTTEDGSRVIITRPVVQQHLKAEGERVKQVLLKDNSSVARFLQGLKLEVGDLTTEAQEKLKEELRKETLNTLKENKKGLSSEAKALNNGKSQPKREELN